MFFLSQTQEKSKGLVSVFLYSPLEHQGCVRLNSMEDRESLSLPATYSFQALFKNLARDIHY